MLTRLSLILVSILFVVQMAHTQSNTSFIKFDKERIELGDVTKGEKRSFQFEFTNISDEAVKIEMVSSCDCTTLDWPRRKIAPGAKGIIDVVFDSTEKDESETVDVDIYLRNVDKKTGHPALVVVDYTYVLKK